MKRRWKDLIVIWLWTSWIVWTIYAVIKIRPGWLAMTMIMLVFLSTFLMTAAITLTDDFGDE